MFKFILKNTDEPKPQKSAGAKVLNNTARLSAVIGNTLQADVNKSANITIRADSIGQCNSSVIVFIVKIYSVVINAQLLSGVNKENGENVTFPNEGSDSENISASSNVPTSALGKHIILLSMML